MAETTVLSTSRPHLGLPKMGEYSIYPVFKCKQCGAELWEEVSIRSGGNRWLFTQDRRRHYKTRCNLKAEATNV